MLKVVKSSSGDGGRGVDGLDREPVFGGVRSSGGMELGFRRLRRSWRSPLPGEKENGDLLWLAYRGWIGPDVVGGVDGASPGGACGRLYVLAVFAVTKGSSSRALTIALKGQAMSGREDGKRMLDGAGT